MESAIILKNKESVVSIILITAIIQGLSLYLLHLSLDTGHWSAKNPSWIVAFYTISIFLPLTIQLLADHIKKPFTIFVLIIQCILFFYFGWHQGSVVNVSINNNILNPSESFQYALELSVLWLMALPFLQCRLNTGRWKPQYDALFVFAWRNKLMLAEAAAFTGVFWMLLGLWEVLFHMLGIDFFKELFGKSAFIYSVTALAFGVALLLIGSIERLTSLILEQVLNVLKWLAIVVMLILALFTATLITKLPTLVFTGQKAIGAGWLLWLIAVTVLLLNAAYRDGSVTMPYSSWLSKTIKIVIPSTIIVAVTAFYALYIRAAQHGLTVERVWAFIVACAAACYAVGYSKAAFDKRVWFATVGQTNIVMAIVLIIVLCASLTPILSPYRLAANSQFIKIQHLTIDEELKNFGTESPFQYLRFHAGGYGMTRLQQLASMPVASGSEWIKKQAQAVLVQKNLWPAAEPADLPKLIDELAVYPAGRHIKYTLRSQLLTDMIKNDYRFYFFTQNTEVAAGVFVDLNNDHIDEFLLLTPSHGIVYEKDNNEWKFVGQVNLNTKEKSQSSFKSDLSQGRISATAPEWNDLKIGENSYSLLSR